MATPNRVHLHAIRSAVMLASDRRTLRKVAAEIGISHAAVLYFIEGAEPRPATLRKLQAWFIEHGPGATDVSRTAVDAALAVLASGVAPPDRPAVRERLLATLREAYEAAGMPVPPEWLAEMDDD